MSPNTSYTTDSTTRFSRVELSVLEPIAADGAGRSRVPTGHRFVRL